MQLLFSLFSSNFLSLSTASTLLLLFSSLFPIYRRLFSNYEKHTFGSEFVNKVRSFSMQKQGRTFCFFHTFCPVFPFGFNDLLSLSASVFPSFPHEFHPAAVPRRLSSRGIRDPFRTQCDAHNIRPVPLSPGSEVHPAHGSVPSR